MNKENTGAIIAGVVLVVVLIGGWFVTAGERGMMGSYQPASTSSSTSSSTSVGIEGAYDGSVGTNTASQRSGNNVIVQGGDSVSVSDQSAGTSVAVASVTLSQAGWIAIRDNTGRTLGAALFPAGTYTNVSVPLLRATSAGQRYQALLYFDDGNKSFDLHNETLVENADGSVAGTMFSVQ